MAFDPTDHALADEMASRRIRLLDPQTKGLCRRLRGRRETGVARSATAAARRPPLP